MKFLIYLFLASWCLAELEPPSIPYLKDHPDEWPRQLVLKEATLFKITVNGQEVGTMKIPENSKVDLLGVKDEGLEVSAGNGRKGVVAMEQTDFLELWRNFKEKKFEEASKDVVFSLELPAESPLPEWYKKQLAEKINPWLEKNSDHPLAARVKDLKAAFENDLKRVEQGETKVFGSWIPIGQEDEWKDEQEALRILAQIQEFQNPLNPEQLTTIFQAIPRYSDTQTYPRLIRSANDTIEKVLVNPPTQDGGGKMEEKAAELAKKADTLVKELTETLKAYIAESSKTKTEVCSARFEDGFYRKPGRYFYAYHFGDLQCYFPHAREYCNDIPPDVLTDSLKKHGEILKIQKGIQGIRDLKNNKNPSIEGKQNAWLAFAKDHPVKEAEEKEIILAQLSNIDKSPFPQMEGIFANAVKSWPNNLPSNRLCLDKVSALLSEGKNSMEQEKFEEAKESFSQASKLLSMVMVTWTRARQFNAECRNLRKKLAIEERKKAQTINKS